MKSRLRNFLRLWLIPTLFALGGVAATKLVGNLSGDPNWPYYEAVSILVVMLLILMFQNTRHWQWFRDWTVRGMAWLLVAVASVLLEGGVNALGKQFDIFSVILFAILFIAAMASIRLANLTETLSPGSKSQVRAPGEAGP
jgi:predicted RND superfamily exporter protein